MFSELDTEAFFAYAKAQHRDLVQQAARDALRRCAVLQKQGKAPRFRRRTVRMRCQTLWQRWVGVARTWASRPPAHTPRTSRG
jgi:hypothetical protein